MTILYDLNICIIECDDFTDNYTDHPDEGDEKDDSNRTNEEI